ncbi:MAG: ATP synthase F1 subunit epsilon [Puniceicoccales bacterium]|jgi:F-type H+-transporting ATPase subunit epsilon|nr:ATP synthase F1 subunit epsilon [Puniceicoccales bacterium]
MAIRLEISTADGTVLEYLADYVSVPTEMGEIGIMSGHVPLVAIVKEGLLRIRSGERRESIAIAGGLLLLQNDALAVTVDEAVNVAKIDVEEAEKARKRAAEALEEAKKAKLDGDEIALLEAKIRYQTVKQMAKKTP